MVKLLDFRYYRGPVLFSYVLYAESWDKPVYNRRDAQGHTGFQHCKKRESIWEHHASCKGLHLLITTSSATCSGLSLFILTRSSAVAAASTSSRPNSPAQATASPTTVVSDSIQTASPNATLACEIFQSYNSICASFTPSPIPANPTPSVSMLVRAAATSAAGNLQAFEESTSVKVSCLCYSSTYYVPYVYDDAANVCGGHPATPTGIGTSNATIASLASVASQSAGFCSDHGNVRNAPVTTFGGYTAAASTPTPTTGAATRFSGASRKVWMWAGATVALTLCL